VTTRGKIALAGIASRLLCGARSLLGLKNRFVAKRGGVLWELDLEQGVDFAIYLFGAFEPDVVAACRKLCRRGNVCLDIGANIGAHTLPLGEFVGPEGRVHAFEPTDFAYRKLLRNISLNDHLAAGIFSSQVFLGRDAPMSVPDTICSSWPLRQQAGLDPMHGGRAESAGGARCDTLDDWMSREKPERIDLLKLDVDGHELDVLRGAEELLKAHKPTLIVEFAPYVFEGKTEGFDELVYFFKDRNYEASFLSGKHLPLDVNLKTLIPQGAGLNAILTPR